MRYMLSALIMLLFSLVSEVQADNPRGWPLSPKLNAEEQTIVIKALTALEHECPGLKEFDWASKRGGFGPKVEYTPKYIVDGGWNIAPAIKGWKRQVLLTFLIPGPTVSITMGWGENSGIAVRTAGKYGGKYLCGLNEQRGEYAYRRVKAFDGFPTD